MSDFEGKAIVAFGRGGTGKTTVAVEWICHLYKKGYIRGAVILVRDEDEPQLQKFQTISHRKLPGVEKGIVKLIVEDPEETFRFLHNWIPPYFAVMADDAGSLLPTRVDSAIAFMDRRRQKKVHFIATCKSARQFPLSLFDNLTEFWIFAVSDNIKSIQGRLLYPKHFERAVKYVNKRVYEGDAHFFVRFNCLNPPDLPDT